MFVKFIMKQIRFPFPQKKADETDLIKIIIKHTT